MQALIFANGVLFASCRNLFFTNSIFWKKKKKMRAFIFADFMFLAKAFQSNQSRLAQKLRHQKKRTCKFRHYHVFLDQKQTKYCAVASYLVRRNLVSSLWKFLIFYKAYFDCLFLRMVKIFNNTLCRYLFSQNLEPFILQKNFAKGTG